MLMREIEYVVRGFLTVRRDSLRVPLSGSLTLNADPDSGLFSGDLTLCPSAINRTVLDTSLFSATVQIQAESPVIGRVDPEGRMFAAVLVDGRPSPGAGGSRRLSTCWSPARGTPPSST
jgi:hypothetical protein